MRSLQTNYIIQSSTRLDILADNLAGKTFTSNQLMQFIRLIYDETETNEDYQILVSTGGRNLVSNLSLVEEGGHTYIRVDFVTGVYLDESHLLIIAMDYGTSAEDLANKIQEVKDTLGSPTVTEQSITDMLRKLIADGYNVAFVRNNDGAKTGTDTYTMVLSRAKINEQTETLTL